MRHAALLCLPLASLFPALGGCESAAPSPAATTLSAWRPTVPLTTAKAQAAGTHFAMPASHGESAAVVTANDSTFESEMAGAGAGAVVNFTAKWCGPCKALAPTIDSLAREQAGRVKVIRVDFDESPATARRYGISALPAVLVVRNGVVVQRLVGYQSRENLSSAMAAVAE